MADGKLVFPVKFDLQSAVKEASGDVDKVLRRLETQINSRPLKIKIDGGFTNMGVVGSMKDSLESLARAQQMIAKDGSIEAMRKEMSALITEWEKLSEKERTATDASGKFSGRAGEIVKRFAELTAAANTHARSLNQLMSAADKAVQAEEKAAQKRAETATRLAALKNPNMDSLTEVKASQKYYEQLAGSAKQFSAGWEICVQRVKELKARSQELSDIYKTMTRQSVLNMPEGNLNEVRDKLKALKIQMEQATPNSTAWNEFANQLSRLREVEKDMVAEQKQAIKTESELRAEREKAALQELANQRKLKAGRARNVSDVERERATRQQLIAQKRQELAVLNGEERSLDQVNAKLEIRRRLLASSKEGTRFYDTNWAEVNRLEEKQRGMQSNTPEAQRKAQEQLQKEWLAAKDQREREREKEAERAVAAANRENQARQAAYNAQRQAGLERQRILNLEENSIANITAKLQLQQERLNNTKFGTAKYEKIRQEVDRLTISLQEAQKKLAETGQRLAALRALREILAANERTVSGLNQKLQYFQDRLSRIDTGTAKWTRTAAEVRRLSDELERANQRMRDFQNAAFKGLSANFTAQQTEAVTRLRTEIDAIDRKFNTLYQNGRATNADGSYNNRVRAMLDERIAKEKEINRILTTAADAQIQREKEISRIQEQRKAKAQAIADKKKAETQAVQKNIAAQKEERRILNQKEFSIKSITDKLTVMQRRLNSADIKSGGFEKIAKEVERLTRKLDEAKRKIAELTGQSTSGASRQTANARKVNEEYSKQLGYVDRLIRRMAVYGSVGMISNFVTKVREVTAQFELQRVSLGAILQDQNKANQLFSEIKSFALKSPVSILDLTKYTKQLAAYKIGYDELFETTKKLTDVSVGLGVSMDRVVLAYGQVRATGHLRASEIRQFTEMGVPIVEELAAKLSKLNGETVTAAQVMDMVSKRAISFEMVKDVFDDMTSAGGIFYNMQEKQGNTLYGLWAKLGDAASVMYSEIGNTGVINAGMKSLIESVTWLMKNWKGVGRELGIVAAGFGVYKAAQYLTTVNTIAASKATRDLARAQTQLNVATRTGNATQILSAQYAVAAAKANRIAANSTNLWTAAKYRLVGATNSLKAALAGNWITLLLTALAAVGTAIYSAYEKAHKLANELSKIKEETGVLQVQSVRNFEYLANSAVKAADGSKQQKDALDELNRTYKDIVPSEALKIENLRKMKGNYDELTQAVREYIAAEQEQKAINTVNETEGAVQTSMQKKLRDKMTDKDLGSLAMSDTEVERFFIAFRKTAQDESKTIKQQFIEAFKQAGLQGAEEMWDVVKGKNKAFFTVGPGVFGSEDDNMKVRSALGELSRSYREQEEQIKGVREGYQQATADLGVYTDAMKTYTDWVEKNSTSGETFRQNQENVNMQIRGMGSYIRTAMEEAGLAWKNEWANVIKTIDPNDLNKTTRLNMEAILAAVDPNKYPELYRYVQQYQKIYDGLIPSDPTVQQIRAKLLAISQSTGVSMDIMRRFLWDGSASVDEHLKYLNDQIEQYEAKLQKMQTTFANSGILGSIASLFLKGKIEETTKIVEALKEQAAFVKTYTVPEKSKSKGSKGSKSDNRLQELQEMYNTLKAINKEYDDLSKKEGKSKAGSWVVENYGATLKRLNDLAKKFNLKFDFPLTPDSLQKYGKQIIDKIKSLRLKGGDKAVIDLQLELAKDTQARLEREIERQLKDLQEKISRTKTAKEFFDKILDQTGDVDLATKITYTIYPETGRDLYTEMQDQIRRVFDTGDVAKNAKLKIRLDDVFDDTNERINYRELEKVYTEYQNDIVEKNRDTARKLIAEGQKTTAAQILNWEKELAKAKDYEQQRTDIIRKATEERARIIKEVRDPNEQKKLLGLSREKESQDLAKVNFEEFTRSDDYIKIFENLDNTATSSLKRLRAEMQKVIDTNKNLSPENMKTLVKAMEDIDSEISGRGFGNDMVQSVKDYIQSIKDMKIAKQELAAEEAEYQAQEPQLDADIDAAKAEEIAAQQDLNTLLNDELATESEIVEAKLRLNAASSNVAKAEEKKANAVKKVNKAEKKVSNEQDKQKKATTKFFRDMEQAGAAASNLASILGDVKDLLGVSEDSAEGLVFDSAIQGLQEFSKIMNVIIGLQTLYNIVTSSNPWIAIAAAVLAVTAALASYISNSKVRKANKEIERQQDLLDQLEYTYGRLEKAAESLFGSDWLANQNQQIKNLEAQARAKEKQAEAERKKGKKEDKEKTEQYLDEARDIRDQIADMEGSVSEKMFGSDLASAARDFAQAWLDAYLSFASTTDAVKEKFDDMIKSMIVNSVLAKVVEVALRPIFDKVDDLAKDGDFSASDIASIMSDVPGTITDINDGLTIGLNALRAAGVDISSLSDKSGEFSGIAKDIAGATSEEINSAAAIGNALMYYVSPVPRIDENVARIVAMMENGGAGTGYAATDYTGLLTTANEHLSSLPRMERHLAEIHAMLGRIIATEGRYSGVNIFTRKY